MPHGFRVSPVLGAIAVVTIAALLPAIGFLLFIMIAGLFRVL